MWTQSQVERKLVGTLAFMTNLIISFTQQLASFQLTVNRLLHRMSYRTKMKKKIMFCMFLEGFWDDKSKFILKHIIQFSRENLNWCLHDFREKACQPACCVLRQQHTRPINSWCNYLLVMEKLTVGHSRTDLLGNRLAKELSKKHSDSVSYKTHFTPNLKNVCLTWTEFASRAYAQPRSCGFPIF